MILTKFDSKQKMLLAIFVVILLVLVWQTYELFKPTPTNIPRIAPAKAGNVVTATAGNANLRQASNAPVQQDNGGAPAAVDANSNSQNQYLRLINEYQMAQVQRMIAEDNEAIAVAKRNAAQALTDTSKLVGGDVSSLSVNGDDSSATASGDYVLVYTGQQDDGSWTATLKKGGQSYDVTPSQALPDGSKVLSIDENGVVLLQGKLKKLVTFSGVVQSAGTAAANSNDIPSGDDSTQSSDSSDTDASADAQASSQSSTADQMKAPVATPPVVNAPVTSPAPVAPKAATPAPAPKKPAPAAVVSAPKPAPATQPKIPAMTAVKPAPAPVAKPTVKAAAPAASVTTTATPVQTAKATIANLDNQEDSALRLPLPTTETQVSAPAAQAPAKSGYTILLSTDKKLESATGFIKDNNLDKNAQYLYVTSSDGDKHYVVIYGHYDTKAAAQAALKNLPEGAKVEGAFITPMATLKPAQ